MDNERYRKGAHTVLDLKYHFVWKTKYGHNVLRGEIGLRTREILQEICVENKIRIVRGNVRANHIHMLLDCPSYLSVGKMAQYLKGKSSYKLQREFRQLHKTYWGRHMWSRGYFCVTVGSVTEEQVKKYIEEQDDTPEGFKVWDEVVVLKSDSSEEV